MKRRRRRRKKRRRRKRRRKTVVEKEEIGVYEGVFIGEDTMLVLCPLGSWCVRDC